MYYIFENHHHKILPEARILLLRHNSVKSNSINYFTQLVWSWGLYSLSCAKTHYRWARRNIILSFFTSGNLLLWFTLFDLCHCMPVYARIHRIQVRIFLFTKAHDCMKYRTKILALAQELTMSFPNMLVHIKHTRESSWSRGYTLAFTKHSPRKIEEWNCLMLIFQLYLSPLLFNINTSKVLRTEGYFAPFIPSST